MKATLFAILLCLAGISNASAESNWEQFTASANNNVAFFLDTNTYKEVTPAIRRIWVKGVFESTSDNVRTAVGVIEINCILNTGSFPIGNFYYDANGQYLRTSPPVPASTIIPGSINDVLRDIICLVPVAAPSSTRGL